MIYLDNAATTKVSSEVRNAMLSCLEYDYGNPGSIHSCGRHASKLVDKYRTSIAGIINALPEQVVFTSGGSEANSLAILGVLPYLREHGKNHIITSKMEHKSVLNPIMKSGFDVTYIQPDEKGCISAQDVEDAILDRTGLVSVMCVNNEIGSMNDIKAIGGICKLHGVLFHTDCVQAFGHVTIDVSECEVDFMSASAHKIHGPKGVGLLYARDKSKLDSFILGGSQEFGVRAGTENVPGIVGFGVAAADAVKCIGWNKQRYLQNVSELTRRLFREFGETMHVNGSPMEGSHICNLRFDGVDGETLVLALSAEGVMVSAGSACNSYSAEPSHVLKAIGLTDDEARSSIRVSMSGLTSYSDIVKASNAITKCVRELRRSP